MPNSFDPLPEAEPSATVVVVRDSSAGLETLLLQRHKNIRFAGGDWVFPGGKIESDELDRYANIELAEKHAAVREASEEAGIELDAARLQKFSHWITPESMPRRFSTGFYIAQIDQTVAVEIDHGEIVEYEWVTPREALARQHDGGLSMMPPTYVSLHELAKLESAEEAVSALGRRTIKTFLPKFIRGEKGVCILYDGDSGYADGDPANTATRHRLLIGSTGYQYLCD